MHGWWGRVAGSPALILWVAGAAAIVGAVTWTGDAGRLALSLLAFYLLAWAVAHWSPLGHAIAAREIADRLRGVDGR